MVFSQLELQPQETIVLEVRKHWIVFIGHAIFSFIAAVLPLVAYTLLLVFVPRTVAQQIISHFFLTLFVYSLWLLLIWVVLFIRWTNYYLDVWYITTERIIDIDQKGVFHREISNLRFDRIQDVTVEVSGVVATFFKFGNLRVQTAAENSKDYTMNNVSHPEHARTIIFEMHNKKIRPSHIEVAKSSEGTDGLR